MATIELPDELIDALSQLQQDQQLSLTTLLNRLLIRDAMFENSMDAILVIDSTARYVDVNPAACKLFGYSREEFLQLTSFDLIHDKQRVDNDRQIFYDIGHMRGEYELKRKDGEIITVKYVAVHNILPDHHVFMCHDVTQQKIIEQQLIESQQRFHAFMDNAPMITYIKNDKLEMIYSNYHSLDAAEVDVVSPELMDNFLEHDRRVLEKNETITLDNYAIEHKDGKVWYQEAKFPIEGVSGQRYVGGIVIDISEQKRIEEELQSLLDNSPVPISIATDNEQIIYINNAFTDTFGYQLDDIPNISIWRKLVHPDSGYRQLTHERWEASIEQARNNNNRIPSRNYKIIDKFGNEHIVSLQGSIIGDKYLVTFLDITEQHNMQEALAYSEAQYRSLFDSSLYSIVVLDQDATIRMINPVGANNLNNPPENIIGKQLHDFFPMELVDKISEQVKQVFETQQALYSEDVVHILGRDVHFWSVAQPVFDKDNNVTSVQYVSYDVTEQRRTEELQKKQETLELTLTKERQMSELRTRLLTTISHEFRTPLAIIQTNSEMLIRYQERFEREKIEEKLNHIIQQIHHLAGMLDNIRTLSKADYDHLTATPKPVKIDELIQQLEAYFTEQQRPKQKLMIHTNIQAETVIFDHDLIMQALTNLLKNAIKYSNEDGEIRLRFLQRPGALTIQIQDDGIGVPQSDIRSIFQPFYRGDNTLHVRGTGLGLAIVKEVVELHRGTITCESHINQGTTFIIQLPTYRESV